MYVSLEQSLSVYVSGQGKIFVQIVGKYFYKFIICVSIGTYARDIWIKVALKTKAISMLTL